jgi:hypothetical protein
VLREEGRRAAGERQRQCRKREKKLAFNQRGPQGEHGLAGTDGTPATPGGPAPVDSAHVVMSGNDVMPGDGCSGTATAPASAPGFVCVYFGTAVGTTDARGFGAFADLSSSSASGDGSPYGFGIQVAGSAFHANGAWAYTAP